MTKQTTTLFLSILKETCSTTPRLRDYAPEWTQYTYLPDVALGHCIGEHLPRLCRHEYHAKALAPSPMDWSPLYLADCSLWYHWWVLFFLMLSLINYVCIHLKIYLQCDFLPGTMREWSDTVFDTTQFVHEIEAQSRVKNNEFTWIRLETGLSRRCTCAWYYRYQRV